MAFVRGFLPQNPASRCFAVEMTGRGSIREGPWAWVLYIIGVMVVRRVLIVSGSLLRKYFLFIFAAINQRFISFYG